MTKSNYFPIVFTFFSPKNSVCFFCFKNYRISPIFDEKGIFILILIRNFRSINMADYLIIIFLSLDVKKHRFSWMNHGFIIMSLIIFFCEYVMEHGFPLMINGWYHGWLSEDENVFTNIVLKFYDHGWISMNSHVQFTWDDTECWLQNTKPWKRLRIKPATFCSTGDTHPLHRSSSKWGPKWTFTRKSSNYTCFSTKNNFIQMYRNDLVDAQNNTAKRTNTKWLTKNLTMGWQTWVNNLRKSVVSTGKEMSNSGAFWPLHTFVTSFYNFCPQTFTWYHAVHRCYDIMIHWECN